MTREVWKSIRDLPYEVSNLGRVRRTVGSQGAKAGKILTPTPAKKSGHPYVGLSKNGEVVKEYVHRLVCAAFHGPPGIYMDERGRIRRQQVRHLDGVESNNVVDNLRWGTQAENEADKILHGTSNRGERQGNAKLAAGDVLHIRESCRPAVDLAWDLGVSPTTIYSIRARTTWAHI